MNKGQFESLSYIEREGGKKLPQRQIAHETKRSLGVVNKTLLELTEKGLISVNDNKELEITQDGLKELEPYRVKRAIILAAGVGSRMLPLTLSIPKPLVRVHNKRIVETLLEAIVKAEIPEIYLVRGYLKEQFEVLLNEYPQIKFIENPHYIEMNNISSVYVARNLLCNAYICEADLVVNNPALIRKYEYCTNYLGVDVDSTDDWCFKVKRGYINELLVGGTDCSRMVGISYWDEKDGAQMADDIDAAFHMPGGKETYWDEVALRIFPKNYNIEVRPCSEGDITEIDTFNELKAIDSVYNV